MKLNLLQSMLRVAVVMWLVCTASLLMACPPASQEEGCNIVQASSTNSHCMHFTSIPRTRAWGAACVVWAATEALLSSTGTSASPGSWWVRPVNCIVHSNFSDLICSQKFIKLNYEYFQRMKNAEIQWNQSNVCLNRKKYLLINHFLSSSSYFLALVLYLVHCKAFNPFPGCYSGKTKILIAKPQSNEGWILKRIIK